MSEKANYQIIKSESGEIDKSGIRDLLDNIRPVWKGKNLIERVERLIPVDASSACQRLFNAAIHDLKEKIIIVGVDLANEAAVNHRLPTVSRDEDILEYNVSKTIDLSYKIGLLTRADWRILHRCYEIRRDLEHEDEEYEAVIQDCFYIFKSTIDIVLSKDPIELLRVTDAKDLVENDNNIIVTDEFLEHYEKTARQRKKEITELLISFAFNDDKPDIVRENSVELMRHLRDRTEKTVKIELADALQKRLGKSSLDVINAKVANACGAIGYFKRSKLKDFYSGLLNELQEASSWSQEGLVCAKIEDVGGLKYCPKTIYPNLILQLTIVFLGEPSYGTGGIHRRVFYSDSAAPSIKRMIKEDSKNALIHLESLRSNQTIQLRIRSTAILNRFERLIDVCETQLNML